MKQFTVAIAGLGARGHHVYAKYQRLHPDRMKITAIADTDPEKVRLVADEYGVPPERRYTSAEEMLSLPRLADVAFIATQDRQHLNHASAALSRGYDILLEKPIAVTPADCIAIRDKARAAGRLAVVCHVLRYTTFFRVIKELIDSGQIGEVVSVQAIENVGYWHQAHSFVRGNWRSDRIESPMILQKCCHDFDILTWLTGKKCLSLSSVGSLRYFKGECAPEGSAARCCDCRVRESCPYDAEKIYFSQPDIGFDGGNREWPCDIVTERPTAAALRAALKTGPYGRCVFHCDNNVVDHQIVGMQLEGGVTVSFTMCGFTAKNSRQIKVMGTLGEITADQTPNTVTLLPFGKPPVSYDIASLTDDLSGHGGGDNRMLTEMFDALERGGTASSGIEQSVQSHLIAFAAEQSRLRGGELVDMKEFEKSV